MPIRKHADSGVWWIDIRTPGGQRVRRSTGTKSKQAAQEYHDKVKAELWRTSKLGEAPERTFDEAAVRFLTESAGQSDYDTKVRNITYWRTVFGGQPLSSLTNESIMDALPTHQTFKNRPAEPLAPATQNRYLATIRRLLRLAAEWDWITKPPKLNNRMEPKVRVRWITQAQARVFLNAITLDWMRHVCQFALATGMRQGEILTLEWSDIDEANARAWVTGDRAKSNRSRSVPLNADAMAVLQSRRRKHDRLVFTRDSGLALTQTDSRTFATACKSAGVTNFSFHGLRHTWASWHVQAGTPLFVLKELGGWETLEMVKKYAHLNPGHLAAHANAVTFWSQQTPEAETPPARVALSA